MRFELDRQLLRADIFEMSGNIGALKRVLRRTWTEPMAEKQRALCQLKRRVTELYALLAYSRGRYHVRHCRSSAEPWDCDAFHRSVAERLSGRYAINWEQSA